MKHFDETTKKLIKNVAALVTSALVLIAATVAWFSSNNNAEAGNVDSTISTSLFSVRYYQATVTDTCTLDSQANAISTLSIAQKEALTWTEVSTISANNLYPGEYNAFKIVVQAPNQSSPVFKMSGFNCTGPTSASTGYNSVYISATAVDASDNVIDSACNTMTQLMTTLNGVTKIEPLTLGTMSSSTTITIYLDIGIPGDDINNTHDALRLTGASISVQSIGVS